MTVIKTITILLLATVTLAACDNDDRYDKYRREAHGAYEIILDGQDTRLIENAYCRTYSPGFGSELYVSCYSHVIDEGRYIWPDYDSRFIVGRLEVMEILQKEG